MMRKQCYLICAAVLGGAFEGNAAVLHVPSEFPTIASASAAAAAGDTILVAPGVYDENAGQGVHLFRGVALLSEGGRAVTTVIGPGLEAGFDPPNQGCLVDGFRFTTEPDQGGVDVYNAGQGTMIARCRFEGLRFGGNNFESLAGLTLLDNELFSYNVHLGVGHAGQTFFLARNLLDGRNSDNTIVLYGSNQFVFRSNTIIAPRSAFTGDLPPTAHVEIVNSLFYAPPEYTQEFGCYPPGIFDIRYNCLWNLVPIPPCPIGPTNIVADPRFCNFAAENYRLQPGSPCIGAGEGGVTIGAFPAGCSVTGIQESEAASSDWAPLVRGFLNPLVPGHPFILELPATSWVRARILDSAGRAIAVLVDGSMSAGTHALEWNGRTQTGSSLASGVYFLTVEALNRRESFRVLVVR